MSEEFIAGSRLYPLACCKRRESGSAPTILMVSARMRCKPR